MDGKEDRYTSGDIQNEILTVMAHRILRGVKDWLDQSKFLSIMVDETTVSANREQVVICMRWIDTDSLEAHEEFLGLYQVDSTDASTILSVIHDVLLRLNISLTKLRGQCYDGAASMSGNGNGVVVQILKEEPRALYTHCYGHALNLACSHTIKRKAPRTLEVGGSDGHFHESVEDVYRQVYYVAIDMIKSTIATRFDQPGYRAYCQLQTLLLKAVNKEEYSSELKFVTELYGEDFDADQLKLHLETLFALGHIVCTVSAEVRDFPAVLQHLRSLSKAQSSLLSQVCILVSLYALISRGLIFAVFADWKPSAKV